MLRRQLPSLLLALSLGLPGLAQLPHFADGTAFGGSKVFSEGMNPLGNSARFDKAESGWFMSYLDGDQKAKNSASILKDLGSQDPALVSTAIVKLQDSPWSQRQKAYGLSYLDHGVSLSYTREETSSILAIPDVELAHLGDPSGLLLNTTSFALRTMRKDRLAAGAGSGERGMAFGLLFRVERFHGALGTAALNPSTGQLGLGDPDRLFDALPNAESHTTWGLDLGMTMELSTGWRLGLTVDQLNARSLWDVREKPQMRAGLQMDLAQDVQLSLEQDLNRVERMPFPVKQSCTAASLRIATGRTSALIIGGERRKVGDNSAVNRGGLTWTYRSGPFQIGLGFQYSEDRPLKGLVLKVN